MRPADVYQNFSNYLAHFLQHSDVAVEDQHFDRKEAGRANSNGSFGKNDLDRLIEHVKETVSAFANSNTDGGVLVIGIGKDGSNKGTNHLTDEHCNALMDIHRLLRGHHAQAKLYNCTDTLGQQNRLILIYVPYSKDAICETLEKHSRSWKRSGRQNLLLSDDQRDQLRRDKRIVDFDARLAGEYDPQLLDKGVIDSLREIWGKNTSSPISDQELLYNKGAIEKKDGKLFFTNSGALFYCANPQRIHPNACIRLLRFDCGIDDNIMRIPSLDKNFDGPILRQITKFRAFLQESSLLASFSIRGSDGILHDVPEYPLVAIDEAVVNAVIHRDYGAGWQIECEYYQDAFRIKNPGRMLQRNQSLPDQFALGEIQLVHHTRNPKIFEWLKELRDIGNRRFVLGVCEGTRSMRQAMGELDLPSPDYSLLGAETILTLRSDVRKRAVTFQSSSQKEIVQHTNLFPIIMQKDGEPPFRASLGRDKRREFLQALKNSLVTKGWVVDSIKYGRLTAHMKNTFFKNREEVDNIVRLYPAYVFQIWTIKGYDYLCLDYTLEVKCVLNANRLIEHLDFGCLIDKYGYANVGEWQRCRILTLDAEWANISLLDYNTERKVRLRDLIPELPVVLIKVLLQKNRIYLDLDRIIKEHSLASVPSASRNRLEKTLDTLNELTRHIMPIPFDGNRVSVLSRPLEISTQPTRDSQLLVRTLQEPEVEFGHHKETSNIRDGITEYGSYESSERTIEIIPVVHLPHKSDMAHLIDRLKVGKYKYKGSERTFHARFTYSSVVTYTEHGECLAECRRILSEHPEWQKHQELDRIFLVHTPEKDYSLDDEQSPYYRIKRFLLENGMPCQMIDTPTLQSPDWKDLNLSLNIVAKCGIQPWVLPQALPDVDCFLGLSYTENRSRSSSRIMAYVNLFDAFGRWRFFLGDTLAFDYEKRAQYFSNIVKDALKEVDLSDKPNICFHYSAKFSREDKESIIEGARSIRPNGIYTFVWINTHHRIRFYDLRPSTDGSLPRGNFVVASPNQAYVSTTGYNPFRKSLGTPIVLEVNVQRISPSGTNHGHIDLQAISSQILALTKLNWASTDSLCGEPITTKYAGDIARLTSAFLRQGDEFELHERLRKTPWFL